MISKEEIDKLFEVVRQYRTAMRRLEQLLEYRKEAENRGGIITISLEYLQDQIVKYDVSPAEIVKYIDVEIQENRLMLENLAESIFSMKPKKE